MHVKVEGDVVAEVDFNSQVHPAFQGIEEVPINIPIQL